MLNQTENAEKGAGQTAGAEGIAFVAEELRRIETYRMTALSVLDKAAAMADSLLGKSLTMTLKQMVQLNYVKIQCSQAAVMLRPDNHSARVAKAQEAHGCEACQQGQTKTEGAWPRQAFHE